jgi:hypothetical protein
VSGIFVVELIPCFFKERIMPGVHGVLLTISSVQIGQPVYFHEMLSSSGTTRSPTLKPAYSGSNSSINIPKGSIFKVCLILQENKGAMKGKENFLLRKIRNGRANLPNGKTHGKKVTNTIDILFYRRTSIMNLGHQ